MHGELRLKIKKKILRIKIIFHFPVWGLGLCSVAVISLSGLFGGLFWPLINSNFYTPMMRILIGLAVGSLSATSIFQLIPEVCIRTRNVNIQDYN
jgi:NhaP-type Na+/H+ and K+/H+ antiporter